MSQIELMNIELELTPESMKSAVEKIRTLSTKLTEALSEFARRLTEELGPGIAKMYVAQFPAIDTGALHDSISGTYIKASHMGTITATAEYAVYVEFGTGIVGEENPHPASGELGIEYDKKSHGESGWWYPSEKGWYKPKDGGPLLAWTKGMPARPFMYTTLRELEAIAESEGGRIIAQYIP